jgi:hypothetical protein
MTATQNSPPARIAAAILTAVTSIACQRSAARTTIVATAMPLRPTKMDCAAFIARWAMEPARNVVRVQPVQLANASTVQT